MPWPHQVQRPGFVAFLALRSSTVRSSAWDPFGSQSGPQNRRLLRVLAVLVGPAAAALQADASA